MGRRLLSITDSLLVEILKGLDGERHCFEVVKDPIPKDAKITAIASSMYHPGVVEITLESSEWDTDEPRTPVCPVIQARKPV